MNSISKTHSLEYPINTRYLSEKNEKELMSSNAMHVTRVIILRGNEKIFLCSNNDGIREAGGDISKAGKYENVGGKTFDVANDDEYDTYLDFINSVSFSEFYNRIIEEAVREVGEESTMNIAPFRFHYIGSRKKDIVGTYKNNSKIKKKFDHFFVVKLQENEYNDLPKKNMLSSSNDDFHDSIGWEDIGLLENMGDETIFSNNSVLLEAELSNIINAISNSKLSIKLKVESILEGGVNNKINSSGFLSQEENHTIISDTDINIRNMSFNDFQRRYMSRFGINIADNTELNKAKESLKYIVKNIFIPSIQRSSDRYSGENHSIDTLIKVLGRKIGNIYSGNDLYNFFIAGVGTREGDMLYNQFIAYRSLQKLPYFDSINDENYEIFQNSLKSLTTIDKKGHYIVKDFSGKPVELDFLSGKKTIERMISKLITKPELKPEEIKDVFRARFVVSDSNDIKGLITLLKRKFGGVKSTKPNSWEIIEKKISTNINSDDNRNDIKLIGNFPIGNGIYIPFEIQIMSRSEYIASESGPSNHKIYSELQSLVGDCKGNYGISRKKINDFLNHIVSDNEVEKSFKVYFGKNLFTSDNMRKEIKNKMTRYFFSKYEGGEKVYYPYQHIFRTRYASEYIQNQDELYLDMCERLNMLSGVFFSVQQWTKIFVGDYDNGEVKERIISDLKKSNKSVNDFINILTETKIGFSDSVKGMHKNLIKELV